MNKKIEKALFIALLVTIALLMCLASLQLSDLKKMKVELQEVEAELEKLR